MVAKPALDGLIDEITHLQRDWLVVADIFHKTVDIAYDERFQSSLVYIGWVRSACPRHEPT